jgi:hypothetical protein
LGHQGGNWAGTLLPFVVIAVVLALRFRRMRQERALNLGTLWIMPVAYALIAGSFIYSLPPAPMGWGLIVIGLAIGLVAGWYRGRLIRIERNAETGELRQRASPLAMLLIVALVGLKLGARAIFGQSALVQPGSGAMLITDAFIGFALGLLSASRAELYLRGRRLLSAT